MTDAGFRRRQVCHPTLGEEQHATPILQCVLVDVRAHSLVPTAGQFLQCTHVDLDVEVPGVDEDRTVLHDGQVLAGDDAPVAGSGHEDVTDDRSLGHRKNAMTLQKRIECPRRVDLGDRHSCAQAGGALRDPLPHQP